MDHLVLAAVEEIALEGPQGCTVHQLWKLLEGNLPPEVRNLTVAVKRQLIAQLRTRPDIEVEGAEESCSDVLEDEVELSQEPQAGPSEGDTGSRPRLVALAQARDMALGMYDQHILHPLNDEMRRTLWMTGKSRKKGAVQSELARVCNVPHKNFFIVVKTLETHSLVVRNNIQIRGDGGRVQTSILHLTRFAPDLAPGLKFAKTSAGDKSLYAVTDDEATVAILLKRMREMDPAGNGIVRSEFKRFVLRTMHTGNMRQNHRLWRRLQTRMVKQGVLDLSVTEVHGKMRTVITALQPEKAQQEQEDDDTAGPAFPLMAERSFAREFFHLVLDAGEEGIVMNELGRHLQFPTRTFHKPNYLQDFLQRLGLIYTKEQKGKTVVVCVRAPGPLLASYRQTNAPEGLWLQHGWLHAVHDAIEAGPPLSELDPSIDLAAPGAPLLLATHAEAASAVLSEAADAAVSQSARRSDLILASPAGSAAVPASTPTAPSHVMSSEQHEQTATRPGEAAEAPELNTGALVQHAAALMPAIPERSAALPEEQGVAEAVPSLTEAQKEAVEAKVQSLPWVQELSTLSQDRVIRMMLEFEKTGTIFRSSMRRFFRDTDPPEVTGSGPDTKTIDRYLNLMHTSGHLQRLSVPVSILTSASIAQELIVYVKPDVQVTDALVSQLVKKWRATSFTLRSEGVSSYHKALKSKSYKPDQEVPKPRPVQPSKLDENIVKQGQDALNKLYDNGFIRAKMIRIRLLHYWICKLLGLGGYERLAPADGQSRPSQHVFTFKAAMPSNDHFQSTAQLTDGVESWGLPLALDATQLWGWMPVEVFLQIVGTAQNLPNRLELTASGKRMRDLSEQERNNVMDQRGHTRTSQHMEMLRCLGLIESVVVAPPDGKAAFSVAPTVASRYVALTTGTIEVQRDKKRSTVTPYSGTTGKEHFEACSFDLTTREGLESYWAQLAQMSVDYRCQGTCCVVCSAPRRFVVTHCFTNEFLPNLSGSVNGDQHMKSKPNHGVALKAWRRPTWFPATTVPDILSRRAWNTLHVMTIDQSEKLKQAFAEAADGVGYVSWVACMHIAKQLGLEYEQVNALSNMRKAKLGRLEPETEQSGSLRHKTMIGRSLSDLPADLVAKHEASVRANTAKRFAKQGIQAGNIARLVEEHIQKNRRVRARAERKRLGLPPHRLRRKPSEIPAQELRSFTDRKERRLRDKASRLDDGELGPGFMPKRRPKRKRASTPAVSDTDAVRLFRGPKGPPHCFTNHEDNAILRAFARWRTHRSPEYFVNFRRFKLPVTLEMAKRRFYKAFPRFQQTQKLVAELQELCIDVYQRHHARKLERWQASQANSEHAPNNQPATAAADAVPQPAQQMAAEQAKAPAQETAAAQGNAAQQQKGGEGQQAAKAGQPAKAKSAEEVVKAKRYITEAKLARLMHRSVNHTSIPLVPDPSACNPNGPPTSPGALPRHITMPLSPQSPHGLPQIPEGSASGTPSAMAQPSTPATLTPLPPGQLPAKSPPGGRPLLDPFEPIFACEDEEDEAALRTVEDMIGLILDVTPRRPPRPSQEPRRRRLFEAEDGEARKRRHVQATGDEDDDSALLGGDAAASMLQGRSAARSWKRMLLLPARGPLQLPGAKKPNVVEAHAMELIKSLLYKDMEKGGPVTALFQHSTVPDLSAALALLPQRHQQQFVLTSTTQAFASLQTRQKIPQWQPCLRASQCLRSLQLWPCYSGSRLYAHLQNLSFYSCAGLAEGDIMAALSQRFTVPEMTAALAFLQQQGLVNVSGVKRPLLLSKLFAEQIEVLDYSEQLPAEASAARQELQHLFTPAATQELPEVVLTNKAGITSGMVCEVMSLMAADRLMLSVGTVQLDSDEQSTEDNVGNQQTSTAVRVPLIATQCQGSTAGHSRSSPAYDDEQHDQPHSGNPSEDLTGQSMLASIPAAGLSSWQQPQPGSLAHTHGKRKAVDEGVRTEDLMLSDSVGQRPKLTAQASSCPGDVDAVSMDVIMRHMDGDAGLTKAQLAEKVARADNSCTNLDATVQACLDAGKLQWAPAFDQQLLVPVTILDRLKAGFRAPVSDDTQPVQDFHSLAGLQAASSKHCQDKTNEMHVAANDAHQQPTATETVGVAQTVNDRDIGLSDLQQTGNSAGASTDNCATRAESGDVTRALMPAQQQQQHSDGAEQSQSEAACGSLLRPWSDHTGALNEPYWAALIQRVMSVVMRNPGIPESLLISQIQALSPQQAKTLLEIMTSQGQLEVQATYDAAPAAVPAVFGLKLDREVQVVLHYFVAPGASFSSLSQLSPGL